MLGMNLEHYQTHLPTILANHRVFIYLQHLDRLWRANQNIITIYWSDYWWHYSCWWRWNTFRSKSKYRLPSPQAIHWTSYRKKHQSLFLYLTKKTQRLPEAKVTMYLLILTWCMYPYVKYSYLIPCDHQRTDQANFIGKLLWFVFAILSWPSGYLIQMFLWHCCTLYTLKLDFLFYFLFEAGVVTAVQL